MLFCIPLRPLSLRPLSLRPTTARLALTASFAVSCALGCANRGMVAPSDGSVSTGGGGGKTDGGAGTGGHGGSAGKGGGGGKGGMAGTSAKDAGCSLLTDALIDHSLTSCNAMFNFESGTDKATAAGSGTQLAFQSVTQTSSPTYCGSGALAIAASFAGSAGLSVKGEVDLPLGTDGGAMNLNGKTLTVHVSANPACDPTLKMNFVIVDASGAQQFLLRNVPLTANWTTASATLSADAGADSAIKIALEVTNTVGYFGTIYVDEIDIR
jgi:hypothetical protein